MITKMDIGKRTVESFFFPAIIGNQYFFKRSTTHFRGEAACGIGVLGVLLVGLGWY